MDIIVKAERIDEDVWDRHRQTIESLYTKDKRKLKKKDGIIEYMKRHHGFTASKSQYEAHFRKWRLRKNLTRQEWRDIFRFINDRALHNKKFEILFYGTVLSKERIIREMARYGSTKEKHDMANRDPCVLPEGVRIQHLPNFSDSGPSSILPPEQALSLSAYPVLGQSVTSSALDCFDAAFTKSPTTTPYYTSGRVSCGRQHDPFFWSGTINWNMISQSIASLQQLTRWKPPAKMQLDAIFYPTLPTADARMILPLYLTTTLLNNMPQFDHRALDDSYLWLKTLPRSLVSRFLEALPAPIFDALRERIFVSAVRNGDGDIVSAMLALNVDPNARIMEYEPSRNKRIYPLESAMNNGHFPIAKAIVSNVCQGATRSKLDQILLQLSDWNPYDLSYDSCDDSTNTQEHVELMCIPLREGAEPLRGCLSAVKGDFRLARKLFETRTENASTWLRIGFLEKYHSELKFTNKGRLLTEQALSYFFREHPEQLKPMGLELRMSLVSVLQSATEWGHTQVTETIEHALCTLGYHRDSISSGDTYVATMQALRNSYRALANFVRITQKMTQKYNSNQDTGLKAPRRESSSDLSEKLAQLKQAVDMNDIERVCYLLKDDYVFNQGRKSALQQAAKLGHHQIAITIVQKVNEYFEYATYDILFLMETSQTAVISSLLRGQPAWNTALEIAGKLGDFEVLSSLVYKISPGPPYFSSSEDGYNLIQRQQLIFRALAYHASETNNDALLKWLLKSGMDMDELICSYMSDKSNEIIAKRSTMDWGLNRGGPDYDRVMVVVLSSLLAVAAERNRLPWINLLLAEGADCRDSGALFRAVKCKAEVATIELLLTAA